MVIVMHVLLYTRGIKSEFVKVQLHKVWISNEHYSASHF